MGVDLNSAASEGEVGLMVDSNLKGDASLGVDLLRKSSRN